MSNRNNLKKSLIEDYPTFSNSDFKPINAGGNNLNTNQGNNPNMNMNDMNMNVNDMNMNMNSNSQYNTLNEGVWVSLKRELVRIFNKTQYVIIPRLSASSNTELRNWDLWGPLTFTMLLNSKTNDEMSMTFCLVFVLMWLGGSIITLNSILLGSKITLCQSLCVLGYCLFPVLVASIILNYLPAVVPITLIIRLGIGFGAFLWASTSSIAFMGDIVGQDKKGLAVFPIYLFYFAFCCYLLL